MCSEILVSNRWSLCFQTKKCGLVSMGQVLTIQKRGLSQGLPVFLVAVQCGQAGAMLEPWRDLRGALIKTGN